MARALVALAAAGALAATALASTRLASSPPRLPRAAPAGEQTLYGHVRSLTRQGRRYVLRFDPAWWLGGVTAERAAVQDGVVGRGQPVPNDYYVVDESHRVLTYLVRSDAAVTVLTRGGAGPIPSTRITLAELAQIVRGRNPRHRDLMEPAAGFWIRVASDTVRSLDQQYQP